MLMLNWIAMTSNGIYFAEVIYEWLLSINHVDNYVWKFRFDNQNIKIGSNKQKRDYERL